MWVTWLLDQGCSSAWIWRDVINDPRISDRMSAGFVGGGGNWVVNTQMGDGKTMNWVGAWDVWNQEAPGQKIWRVDYNHIGTKEISVPEISLELLSDKFSSTLRKIADFAYKIDAEGFAKCFEKAQAALQGERIDLYHNDLLPKHTYNELAQKCIKSCQSAWVFGGMGSWNDMWFDDQNQKEYEELSEKCFSELNNLIIATTNSAAKNRLK